MSGNPSRLFAAFLLFGGFVWIASEENPAAAQPKKAAAAILVEPLALRPGEALSNRTLVQRPPSIPGIVSWSIETRRHRGPLNHSALSPDGKQVATGGMDGIIRIWNAESGEFVRALVGHGSYVMGVAWSPDGKSLASAGSYDGTARIWDAATGMTVRTLREGHKGYTSHVAWSRDGKSLVVAGGISGFMTLWDVAKAESVKTAETGNAVTGLVWGPGDRRIAVSCYKIGVQIWDAREGRPIQVLPVPGQDSFSVAWSPDGKLLVGGAAAKTLIWDVETGKQKEEFDISGYAAAFSEKGDALAVSVGPDVKLWQGGFDKAPKSIPMTQARTLNWSPDGENLFGTSSMSVKWCSIEGKKPSREIDAAAGFPVQLTAGRPLISGFHTKTPTLWDTTTCKLVAALEGHADDVSAAAWSKDGKLLATASKDKTVRLWDASGKVMRTLAGHEGFVRSVAWADGKTLASGSADATVRLWQASSDTGKIVRKHNARVNAVAWSKDGKHLASGDQDHVVLHGVVDAAAQSITAGGPIKSLAWSPNGKNLAVGLFTGQVEVFAPQGGKKLQTFIQDGSPPMVSSLAWTPNGTALLAGRSNHSAQAWRMNSTVPILDFPCMAPVFHVGWSPAGNSGLVSESDRSARTFDLNVGLLRSTAIVDSKQLAIVSSAGHYRVADEATCELVYVVQTAKGQETFSPKEFAAKYRFRNNPAAVVLMDK